MKKTRIITDALEILTPDNKEPVVTFYYGIEGIKEVYRDTLSLPKEDAIYSFLNPEEVHQEIYQWLTTEYVRERAKRGIFAHVFVTNSQNSPRARQYKKLDDKEKRITLFVEDYEKPFECEVDIYGDKVAFINYNPKGPLVGIVIQHPIIASTLKAFYLHYLWKV